MRWFLLIPVLAVLSSCSLPSAAEGRVTAIEANLSSLRKVQGRLPNPSGPEAAFTAYFQQMDLEMIEEEPVEGGPVRNRYYFHFGNLLSFHQYEKNQLGRRFTVNKKGALQHTLPAAFPQPEYTAIASRALELKSAAVSRAGQMFVFPLMRSR